MSDLDEIWRRKSDDEILAAVMVLAEYAPDGQRVILAEAAGRGLNAGVVAAGRAALESAPQAEGSRCGYCGTFILFGGRRVGPTRFCSAGCQVDGVLMAVSQTVPQNQVDALVQRVFEGNCPRCEGPGPVDVHVSHRVWSAVYLASWRNRAEISCRRCGNRARMSAAAFSALLGWWSLPGLVMTPVQLTRNVIGLLRGSNASAPSARLQQLLRLHLAAQMATGASPAGGADAPLH